jgi:predicted permease
MALLRFLAARLDRRQLEREMDAELGLHIELHEEALRRAGLPPEQAHRRAIVEFGGVQRYREEARDARTLASVHDLLADLRYGLRTLRHSRLFTGVSVLSLSLGIGANVAIFGILYGILMQPLAIPRAGELAALALTVNGDRYTSILRSSYRAIRQAPDAPPMASVHEADDVLVETPSYHEYERVDFVDGPFFQLIGVAPLLGRTIGAADDAESAPVVVLSEGFWRRVLVADTNVIGHQISLHGHLFTIVGVMPHSYRGLRFNGSFTMAVPASFGPSLGVSESHDYVNVVTRAATPEARIAFAGPLDAVFHRCCLDSDRLPADSRLTFVDASRGIPFGKNDFRDDYRTILWSLMGAVLLVLLVACSNVGNLLLARAASRERELSIRLAIGASRWRVVRQLVSESALLGLFGAIAGLGLAALATRVLIASLPGGYDDAAALVSFRLKPAIVGFTAAITIVSVLAFGLGPALRATRGDLRMSLVDRGGVRHRSAGLIDRMLVIGQVALTLVLVCGAALLVATLHNLRAVDPGFATSHLVAIDIETRGSEFERGGIVPIYREILDRAREVPGVRAAAMATRVPAIGGRNASFAYTLVGHASPEPDHVNVTVVTPGYFATSGTALRGGRDFGDGDTPASTRVAIANESFVRRHFVGRSPLGSAIRLEELNGGETVMIVGIAHDVRFGDRRSAPEPMLYIPAAQAGNWPFMLLLMRTGAEPNRVVPNVARALDWWSRRLRVSGPQTMDEAFDEVLLRERLGAGLASACAALGLLLAMVGLAGLVGFSITRRTREIGVRMALGARRAGILWLVLRGALAMALVGVVIGGPLALGAGAALRSMLFGVTPTSFAVLGGAAAALVAVAAAASALPAWRAARVDPVIALRAD